MENTVENKHSSDEITIPLLKFKVREEFSCIEESFRFEDEGSIDVDWEGELISTLEDLKKSRKDNKVLKDQLEKEKKR